MQMLADSYSRIAYYSVREYPDTRVIVTSIQVPLLWIAGSEDRRTRVYDMASLFARVPDNKHSAYELLRGTHKSVLFNHVAAMTQWIGGL